MKIKGHHYSSVCLARLALIVLILLSSACDRTVSPTTVVSPATANAPTFAALPASSSTATPSATRTLSGSATPLPSATRTPAPVPTSTNTFAPTPTNTAAPTSTNTAVPTPTDTATPTQAADNGPVEVDFIDVGQGDAILVRSSAGQVALIDGGEQGSGVLAYLTGKGISHIDLMVATHPHADHIGGLVDVLGALAVDKVVTNGQPHTTQIYERFLDGIANARAEYSEVKRGHTLPLGNLTFQVLSPVMTAPGGDMNNDSVVLRLVVGQVAFIFTGDAQADAEAGMMGAGLDLSATILKVGHHGSNTSSTPAFLSRVKPAMAVYMAGAGNSYGHPHAEVITALTGIGAQIYGTDTNGTIIVTTDGSTYQVQAQGGPRAPPVVQLTEPPAQGEPASLVILSVTSPVRPGASATLAAQTAPGTNCAITVYYKSGPSKAKGLEPKVSDGSGNVSWSWKVGSNTTPGTWRIVVQCDQDGQSVTADTNFTVQK